MLENSNHSYPILLYPPEIYSILNSYPPINDLFSDLPEPHIMTTNKFLIFLVVMTIITPLLGRFPFFIFPLLYFIYLIIIFFLFFLIAILGLDFDLDINDDFVKWLDIEYLDTKSKYDTCQDTLLKNILMFIHPLTPIIYIGFPLFGKSTPDEKYKLQYNEYKQEYYQIIDEYKSKIEPDPLHELHYEIIRSYRKDNIQKIKRAIELAKEPKNIDTPPKKGYLEDYFYNYLISFFGDNIKVDLQLKKPEFDYPYTPDFIYQDLNHNLYIDIEIDEPYVKNTKNPIHINDSIRNEFFLDSKWIIIRFAEEQIYRSPYSCCKHISRVISNITGESVPNSLQKVDDLEPIPCWDYAQAKEMADNDYRESYLNNF